MLQDILEYNRAFVERNEYEPFQSDKYPRKKIAVVTCMDTRLVELLPSAMGIKNGDAQIIKTAGAMVTNPYGGIARSLIVAVYEMGVEEIYIIGHEDCGMECLDCKDLLEKITARGLGRKVHELEKKESIDLHQWLHGFECVDDSVWHSVELVKNHPLIPDTIKVYGLVMNPATGELRVTADCGE